MVFGIQREKKMEGKFKKIFHNSLWEGALQVVGGSHFTCRNLQKVASFVGEAPEAF